MKAMAVLLWMSLGFTPAVNAAQAAATGPQSGFLQGGDAMRLAYRVEGRGEPLVIVHGGPALSFTYLQPELGALAERHTLIYYDQRGGGTSSLTLDADLLTMEAHVADLEAVRRHFGLDRMNLLGHSWGAALVAHYAARHPGRVAKMVLVDVTPPRSSPYLQQFEANVTGWMDAATLARIEGLQAALSEPADPVAACRDFWQVFILGYVHDRANPPAFRGSACDAPAAALRNGDAVYAATIGSLGDWDWRAQMADVAVPALIIHGASDPIPVAAAREWAGALPDARLAVIARAGHFPFVEQPQQFFPLVLTFLRGE